jgi:hypothetical protein
MNAMRPTRLTKTFIAAAAGLALGAAMLALPAPARAADDDVPIDTKILRAILEGIGLQRGEKNINYQDRPPLVIPPGKDLPPPEKFDAVTNNPAWPKDPDVARAKLEKKVERESFIDSSDRQRANARPLLPSQLTPGNAPRHGTAADNSVNSSNGGDRLSPNELGYKGGLFSSFFGKSDDKEAAKFTGERPRTSLTDPPAGYQVPAPDQPYGPGKVSGPKAQDYYLSRESDINH